MSTEPTSELVKRLDEIAMKRGRKGLIGAPPVPVHERFWAKVDRRGADECWPWKAGTDAKGYGRIVFEGRTRRAPQIAWSIYHGVPFPRHLSACHSCDNPNCVNPHHIWPGTQKENLLDAVNKGRRKALIDSGNSEKTHCPAGHVYTPENTILSKSGKRTCRECQKGWSRDFQKRRRESGRVLRLSVAMLKALHSAATAGRADAHLNSMSRPGDFKVTRTALIKRGLIDPQTMGLTERGAKVWADIERKATS